MCRGYNNVEQRINNQLEMNLPGAFLYYYLFFFIYLICGIQNPDSKNDRKRPSYNRLPRKLPKHRFACLFCVIRHFSGSRGSLILSSYQNRKKRPLYIVIYFRIFFFKKIPHFMFFHDSFIIEALWMMRLCFSKCYTK